MFPSQQTPPNNYINPQQGSLLYYPNIEPYNNQNFLNTTFGFNNEYITAFHTLPHEQKLKFYISVQQMKMLGFMNDRLMYQNILKQISRRYNIIKKTESPNNQQNNNNMKDNNMKEDIWGAKLQNLCQDHLKKIQKDNLLQDIPIAINMNSNQILPVHDFLSNQQIPQNSQKQNEKQNKIENEQDQFEWAQQQQQQNNSNISYLNNNIQQDGTFSKNINHKYSIPITNNNQINQNMINYQKHNSLPIYLPTTNTPPIDVWDLQIIQDQPDKIKNIIYNSKTHLPAINQQNCQKINSQVSQKISQKQTNPVINENSQNFKNQTNTTNLYEPFDFMATSSLSQNQQQHQQINKTTINFVSSQNSIPSNNQSQEDDQFQWQQNPIQSNPQIQQILTLPTNPPPIENTQIQQANIQNNQHQENNNNFDLNFFQFNTKPIKQTIPIESIPQNTNPTINNPPNSLEFESSFGFDLNFNKNQEFVQNQNYSISNFNQQNYSQSNNIDSMMTSTMFSTINTSILNPLKKFPTSDKVVAALKKKVFDFDRHFYQQALQLIQTLGYENSPDYTYIQDESKICQQIYNLSEAYTAAVEEDTEEMVARNLKKCKQLYAKLDANKTAKITKKYLMMQGQTLSFKMGKMALESGISPELLEKNINSPKFNEIATILYVMSFLGTIHTTSTLASQIIQYVEYISDQIQEIRNEINNFDNQISDIVKNSDPFKQYLISIKNIATKAQQLIILGKLSSKDDFYYNVPKFFEKLSSLSSFSPSSQLIPNYYVTFLSQLSNGTNNIYSMHKQMRQFIQEHPLCSICYESLQNKQQGNQGGKRDDGNYYHYKCWNLKIHVIKFKNTQMTNITENMKSSKLFSQNNQNQSIQQQSIQDRQIQSY